MPRGCILSVPSISLHSSYVHALKLVLKNKNKNQGTSNKEGAMARTFATLYEVFAMATFDVEGSLARECGEF
jgi:hypothetical protein